MTTTTKRGIRFLDRRSLLLCIATITSTTLQHAYAFAPNSVPTLSAHHKKASVDGIRPSAVKFEEETTTTSTKSSAASAQQQLTLLYSSSKEEECDTLTTTITPPSSLSAAPSLTATETGTDIQTPQDSPLQSLLWRGAVVMLCAVWASNFPATKLIIAEPNVDGLLFAVARFSVASLALLPFALKQIRTADPAILRGSAECGAWVAFGYLGQLLGLLTTTASRSCVICSLHCVFVAIIAEFMRTSSAKDTTDATSSFDLMKLVPAVLAVTGVAIVELQGAGGAPTIGDFLSFAQPIGFGIGYLKLEELMRKSPESAVAVSTIKLCMVALASLVFFELQPLVMGTATAAFRIPDMTPILASPVALAGVLYTGLITTALALYVESIAFRRVPATDASIILTTEPLFAAVLGAVTLGETFGLSDYAGASLIVAACVAAVRMGTHEE